MAQFTLYGSFPVLLGFFLLLQHTRTDMNTCRCMLQSCSLRTYAAYNTCPNKENKYYYIFRILLLKCVGTYIIHTSCFFKVSLQNVSKLL